MARKKKKKSSRAMGDDPLSWLREGGNGDVAHGKPADRGRQIGERQAGVNTETAAQPERVLTTAETSADRGAGTAGGVPIVLDAIITIAEAPALKERLLPHVHRQGEISIDGSRVESIDTAALQVLLAFVRSVHAQGAVIRWTGISAVLLNTAQLLGVARLIGLQA